MIFTNAICELVVELSANLYEAIDTKKKKKLVKALILGYKNIQIHTLIMYWLATLVIRL